MNIRFSVARNTNKANYNPMLDPGSIENQLGLSNDHCALAYTLTSATYNKPLSFQTFKYPEMVCNYFLSAFENDFVIKSFKTELVDDLMHGESIEVSIQAELTPKRKQESRDALKEELSQHFFYHPFITEYDIQIEPYTRFTPIILKVSHPHLFVIDTDFVKFMSTNPILNEHILTKGVSSAVSLYIEDGNKYKLDQYQLNYGGSKTFQPDNPLHLICAAIDSSNPLKKALDNYSPMTLTFKIDRKGNLKVKLYKQLQYYFTLEKLGTYARKLHSASATKIPRRLSNPEKNNRATKRRKPDHNAQRSIVPANFSGALFKQSKQIISKNKNTKQYSQPRKTLK